MQRESGEGAAVAPSAPRRAPFRTPQAIAAVAILLIAGLAHGLLSGRWENSRALADAAARVGQVPRSVGEWRADTQPADPEVYAQAGAVSYWVRAYRRPDAPPITVILMCGPAGKMSVHTPDVCYRGAGYHQDGAESTVTLRPAVGTPTEARVAQFSKPGAAQTTRLRIYWTWASAGAWGAPDRPRWTYAGAPFLYKLYAVQEVRDGEGAGSDEATRLLRELLPQLTHGLFPLPAE